MKRTTEILETDSFPSIDAAELERVTGGFLEEGEGGGLEEAEADAAAPPPRGW